jgi:hypothetical protein
MKMRAGRLLGPLRVISDRVTAREHLHADRLASRLARLPDDDVDDLVLTRHDLVEQAPQVLGALGDGQRAPRGLRLARALHRGAHVLRAGALELADRRQRHGAHGAIAAARAGGGNGLDDRHAELLAEGRATISGLQAAPTLAEASQAGSRG